MTAQATLVTGSARGELLWTDTPLSFWGGVDPESGVVIDKFHPLCGASLSGKLVALPRSRGSCSGSGVLMQLLLNGNGPSGLIFREPDEILPLGIIVAKRVFQTSIPAVCVDRKAFDALAKTGFAAIEDGRLQDPEASRPATPPRAPDGGLRLTAADRRVLAGADGKARQIAMEIVVEMAEAIGARELMDIERAHIDGCLYTGEAGLRFAQLLGEWGGAVRVPTTLNAISVDQRRWRALGVPDTVGIPASKVAEAYIALGARPTFTCAPYFLDDRPVFGEQIAWAESNAVVFANSVIGARTLKYPDYLDICVAITGRAPMAGCHLDEARRPTLAVEIAPEDGTGAPLDNDVLYPLLGYLLGARSEHHVPIVSGLEQSNPTVDDLKALCAAFATTSSAPMLHIRGITPEAKGDGPGSAPVAPVETVVVTRDEVRALWQRFGARSAGEPVDLIAIGNPHCSVDEIARMDRLFGEWRCRDGIGFVVTCGQEVYEKAARAGLIAALAKRGVTFLNDTCWCMIDVPVIPPAARRIMTNSAKYAHYGPGMTGRSFCFGGLAECIDVACSDHGHPQA